MDILITILLMWFFLVGLIGGFSMYLAYDEPIIIRFWNNINNEFVLLGCILIMILSLPALLFCLITETFYFVCNEIIEVFYKLFDKGE